MTNEAPKSTATTPIRPLTREVLEQLGKILPRLATAHDGEKAAVVTAISNKLTTAGYTWYDFAGHFTTTRDEVSDDDLKRIHAAGIAEGYAKAKQERAGGELREVTTTGDGDHSHIASEKLILVIEKMRACCRFTEQSESFLNGLLERADKYTSVRFSPKMKNWFLDLMRQARARGAQL